ncbi:MAG: sigma-54 dependent transcriptional regulator [Pirellulales bacterium]
MAAFDYLSKPLDLEKLEEQVEHAVEARRLMRVPVVLGDAEPSADHSGESLIGRSEAMQEVYKAIGRVTQLDAPVLIAGEPGTGKELVARAIYQNGNRASAPFQIVKCEDFTSPWLESELFGHEEGAFAGAHGKRIGRLEQCVGGLIVLEEIGQTSPAFQSRLFRLLTSQEFERVGGSDTLKANIGIIATTSQSLDKLLEQGLFRADLYYLLSSFTIYLPPLRDRVTDLPLLVDYFVKKISHITRSFSSEVVRVSSEALSLLTQHRWPGNLDEMQSVLRRPRRNQRSRTRFRFSHPHFNAPPGRIASSFAPSAGSVTDWQQFCSQRLASGTSELYAEAVAEMELHLLERVLSATSGNQARAAKILGITRGNLRKKIRSLGIVLPGNHALATSHDEEAALDTSDSETH